MRMIECKECKDAKLGLREWINHLVSSHVLPTEWPSERFPMLDPEAMQKPYTSISDSRKKRKLDKIPRPLNSFMLFAQHIRRNVLRVFTDVSNVEISRHLGEAWANIPRELKSKYDAEAVCMARIHQLEYPGYRYQPNKRSLSALPPTKIISVERDSAYSSYEHSSISSCASSPIINDFMSPSSSSSSSVTSSPIKLPYWIQNFRFHKNNGKRAYASGDNQPNQPAPRHRYMSGPCDTLPILSSQHHPPISSCFQLPPSETLIRRSNPEELMKAKETVVPVFVVRGSTTVREFTLTLPVGERKDVISAADKQAPASCFSSLSSADMGLLRTIELPKFETDDEARSNTDVALNCLTDEQDFMPGIDWAPAELQNTEADSFDAFLNTINLNDLLDCTTPATVSPDAGNPQEMQLLPPDLQEIDSNRLLGADASQSSMLFA